MHQDHVCKHIYRTCVYASVRCAMITMPVCIAGAFALYTLRGHLHCIHCGGIWIAHATVVCKRIPHANTGAADARRMKEMIMMSRSGLCCMPRMS